MTDDTRAVIVLAQLRKERSHRLRIFGQLIAASDCAWNMLLELADARRCGRQTTISSLCVMSLHPTSTALRWIRILEADNLVRRLSCNGYQRRVLIELTDRAISMLDLHLAYGGEPPEIQRSSFSHLVRNAVECGLLTRRVADLLTRKVS